jgi:hypothetical protein
VFAVVACGLASAGENTRLPEGLPALAGTAVVSVSDERGPDSAWTIGVSLEEETWKEVLTSPSIRERWKEKLAVLIENGQVQLEPEVSGTGVHRVASTRMIFQMNKPDHYVLCRIFDISGKELSREALIEQLAGKTPVLVSLSGQMPHHQYLQLVEPDTLVVLIAPDDKVAAPVATAPRCPEDKAQTKNSDGKKTLTGNDYVLAQQRLPQIHIESAKEASDYMRGIWKMDENVVPPSRQAEAAQLYVICTGDWLVVRWYLKRGETVRDELNRIDGFVLNGAGRKHTRLEPKTSGRRPCNWDFVPIDQDHLHLETYDTVIPLQRIAEGLPSAE